MSERDWSISDGVSCNTCTHAGGWPHYPPAFRVCRHPQVLEITGGPRSCADVVRAPGGVCGPTASFHARRP